MRENESKSERVLVRITLPPDRGGEFIEPFDVEVFVSKTHAKELRHALKWLAKKKK